MHGYTDNYRRLNKQYPGTILITNNFKKIHVADPVTEPAGKGIFQYILQHTTKPIKLD